MGNRLDESTDLARRTLITLAAAAPILAAACVATGAELPADLANAVSAYDRATVSNDTAALSELVADDYVLVNSDSSLQDKQSYLGDFRVPGFRLEPYTIQQPISKVWGDTALFGGILPLAWTQDAVRNSRLLRIAHVWTKRDSRWRLAYTQLTRVPGDRL